MPDKNGYETYAEYATRNAKQSLNAARKCQANGNHGAAEEFRAEADEWIDSGSQYYRDNPRARR